MTSVARAEGTVEGISIRWLRLRRHRGAVHTVPYELKALTNHSRDRVIVKLEFQVTYDTDAKPGEQFVIRREALQRIKRAFDAAGIRFAYPTVTVQATPAGAATDGVAPALTDASAAGLLARRNAAAPA